MEAATISQPSLVYSRCYRPEKFREVLNNSPLIRVSLIQYALLTWAICLSFQIPLLCDLHLRGTSEVMLLHCFDPQVAILRPSPSLPLLFLRGLKPIE